LGELREAVMSISPEERRDRATVNEVARHCSDILSGSAARGVSPSNGIKETPTVSILNNRPSPSPAGTVMTEYKAGPRRRKPKHPGAIVAGELAALGLTPYAAAPLIGVTRQALGNIVAEKSAISPAMALRLGKFFGNGAELWLGLQADCDLWQARLATRRIWRRSRP
jgi:antitoxin HigA-1